MKKLIIPIILLFACTAKAQTKQPTDSSRYVAIFSRTEIEQLCAVLGTSDKPANQINAYIAAIQAKFRLLGPASDTTKSPAKKPRK